MYEEEVARVLSAGIPPIDFQVAAIRRCDTNEPRGYITRAVINSLDLGTLTPADYLPVTDTDAVGLALSARMIRKSLALLDGAEEPPALMAVHVPLALLRERAPEAWLSPILAQHRLQKPETLCLCFDAPLLLEFGADAHDALLHLKRSGVTLAVRGCGADKIPLAPLMRLPVDYAFLSPEVTALADDRVHSDVLTGLVGYLHAMGQKVIAEDVSSDGQLRALERLECFGYLPSESFSAHSGRGSLFGAPTGIGGADLG